MHIYRMHYPYNIENQNLSKVLIYLIKNGNCQKLLIDCESIQNELKSQTFYWLNCKPQEAKQGSLGFLISCIEKPRYIHEKNFDIQTTFWQS
jgi:hypothetical protein